MLSIKPPIQVEKCLFEEKITVFLAWSIEQDTAHKWQQEVENALTDLDVVILNPRRDNWDSNWKENIDNQEFYSQVNWEIDWLENAKFVIFYFDPKTKSPITMYELWLCTHKTNIIACCPDWFWKKWNVDIVCKRNNIPQATSLNELIELLKEKINELSLN